jgi:NAD(P)-dependent dehydrogenase (short-subunit alcohol dehydrogenase family)
MAYGISKAAIINLGKTMAIEWGKYGIRSNVICPGQFITDMTRERFNEPEAKAARLGATPLGRYGEVEDIANGVYFLCTDASSYITGETLLIDGGVTVNMYHVQGKQ